MSYKKSYIRNLTQKYRLAAAIAVLKEKPQNVSIESYIDELNNKINNNCDDLDDTICSDDFNLEDNDDNIIINRYINDTNVCSDDKTIDNNIDLAVRTNNENDRLFNDVVYENGKVYLSNNEVCHDTSSNEIQVRDKTNYTKTYKSSIKDSVPILENVLLYNTASNGREVENSVICTMAEEHAQAIRPFEATQLNSQNDTESTFCETGQNSKLNATGTYIEKEDAIKKSVSIINEATPTYVQFNLIDRVHENNMTSNIDETFYDSQATELYSVHGFSQNYTHVSQSQDYNRIVLNDKFIKTINNKIDLRREIAIEYAAMNNNEIRDFAIDEITNDNKNTSIHTADILSIEDVDDQIDLSINQTDNYYTKSVPSKLVNQNSMEIIETYPQYAQDFNEFDNNTVVVNEINENIDKVIEMNEEDATSSNETEIVSFKVVQELNKVKNYINRKVERRISNDGSIDSGYKSDSQKSSYRNSLQLSGNWLNQSAHSLYEYITRCPLLAATQEIVNEIAQVLGQLVDKLHEEEKYPSFLEELLENVGNLLQDLLHGNADEDALLKKDEITQRLFLLNKSTHIQKYTLEKIANILEDFHSHVTNSEELYDITHTTEIENIAYIFHVLEVILQKYSKNKKVVSQEIINSQGQKNASQELTNSQGELKKTSIADIWRRKWNPNYKEDVVMEEMVPKKCVLLKCNEVLNKLVVGCMEGYSLIAFSALQCFNLLQC